MIIKGAPIYEHAISEISTYVKNLDTPPCLVVITNDDPGAVSYIKALRKDCDIAGITLKEIDIRILDHDPDVIHDIEYQSNIRVDAIMVQTPIPEDLSVKLIRAVERRYGSKLIDYWHPETPIYQLDDWVRPATPRAIMAMIRYVECDIINRNNSMLTNLVISIVNRSNALGRYLIELALDANMLPKVMHSQIRPDIIRGEMSTSDVVISATGHPNYSGLDEPLIPSVFPVLYIDLGTGKDEVTGHIGDFSQKFYESVETRDNFYLVPSVGGIGPVTRVMLLASTLASYQHTRMKLREARHIEEFMRNIGTYHL